VVVSMDGKKKVVLQCYRRCDCVSSQGDDLVLWFFLLGGKEREVSSWPGQVSAWASDSPHVAFSRIVLPNRLLLWQAIFLTTAC
jgi:hypothetical protein